MPQFYFDLIEDGQTLRDEQGVALVDIEAAKAEARKALADLIRDEIRDGTRTRAEGEVAIHIRDHTVGPVVLTVSYSVVEAGEV